MAKLRDCGWQIRHWKRFKPLELLQEVLQLGVPRVLRLAEWSIGRSRNDKSLHRNAFRKAYHSEKAAKSAVVRVIIHRIPCHTQHLPHCYLFASQSGCYVLAPSGVPSISLLEHLHSFSFEVGTRGHLCPSIYPGQFCGV
jgi:hypothetical protein